MSIISCHDTLCVYVCTYMFYARVCVCVREREITTHCPFLLITYCLGTLSCSPLALCDWLLTSWCLSSTACMWNVNTLMPYTLTTYHTQENFGREKITGESWAIRQNFPHQFSQIHGKHIWHMHWLLLICFSLPIALKFTRMVHQNFPRQIFPVYSTMFSHLTGVKMHQSCFPFTIPHWSIIWWHHMEQ